MTTEHAASDPLEFVRNMWGRMGFSLPCMVTPTLDVDELDKRITDMRAVEGWLKMNLNMLQMAIQGLDIQRSAIAAVRAITQPQSDDDEPAPVNPFMWSWNTFNVQQTETEPVPEAKSVPASAYSYSEKPAEDAATPRARRKTGAAK